MIMRINYMTTSWKTHFLTSGKLRLVMLLLDGRELFLGRPLGAHSVYAFSDTIVNLRSAIFCILEKVSEGYVSDIIPLSFHDGRRYFQLDQTNYVVRRRRARHPLLQHSARPFAVE